MNQEITTPARKGNYRAIGHLLLWVGFLWIVASRLLFGPSVLAKTSRFASDGITKQESYTPTEVFGIISQLGLEIRHDPPWMVPPALLMLVGGILLARSGRCSVHTDQLPDKIR